MTLQTPQIDALETLLNRRTSLPFESSIPGHISKSESMLVGGVDADDRKSFEALGITVQETNNTDIVQLGVPQLKRLQRLIEEYHQLPGR